jgi:hypothetical protein
MNDKNMKTEKSKLDAQQEPLEQNLDKSNEKLKIYRCEFVGLYPTGSCLVLAAYNQEQAEEMARKTVSHTTEIVVNELDLKEPQIIEYLSGDY